MGFSFYPLGDSRPSRPCLLQFVFTVFLECKTGITGVPFGRTKVSIPLVGSLFRDLSHRHGPVGTSLQGMPENFDFHVFSKMFC